MFTYSDVEAECIGTSQWAEKLQGARSEAAEWIDQGTWEGHHATKCCLESIHSEYSFEIKFFCLVAINSQKNDSEKKLILMNRAHKSQNEVLQRLQEKADKIRRYEEAMRKQEKVIEKLEKVANKAPISESLIQSASE